MILAAAARHRGGRRGRRRREARRARRGARPDVVLMDVRMPELDGIEATRRLARGRAPTPEVLVLTTFDLDEYVYEALRAGAGGFLLKDAPPSSSSRRSARSIAGDALLAPRSPAGCSSASRARRRRTGRHAARARRPDQRENDVLRLIADGRPTPRSPAALYLARRRSRPTSPASSPSWGCATASRPSRSPTARASWMRTRRSRSPRRLSQAELARSPARAS